jgi:hypothetical protein
MDKEEIILKLIEQLDSTLKDLVKRLESFDGANQKEVLKEIALLKAELASLPRDRQNNGVTEVKLEDRLKSLENSLIQTLNKSILTNNASSPKAPSPSSNITNVYIFERFGEWLQKSRFTLFSSAAAVIFFTGLVWSLWEMYQMKDYKDVHDFVKYIDNQRYHKILKVLGDEESRAEFERIKENFILQDSAHNTR